MLTFMPSKFTLYDMRHKNEHIFKLAEYFESLDVQYTLNEIKMLWTFETLRRCRGNRTHCARHLGISYKAMQGYLYTMREMGLKVPAFDITSKDPYHRSHHGPKPTRLMPNSKKRRD